jgi:drug/metabolite transporter (DMT)-like permease
MSLDAALAFRRSRWSRCAVSDFGTLTLAFAWYRGLHIPRGKELAAACIAGLGTLTIGNGALVVAETLIPSGMAGLITAMSPFWMVGVEALLPGGESLHAPTIGAMALGWRARRCW